MTTFTQAAANLQNVLNRISWHKVAMATFTHKQPLSSEEPLDGVAGHGVEEEGDEGGEEHDDEDLDDHPLVVVPQDVADRLPRVHEPHEGRVRPTARKYKH